MTREDFLQGIAENPGSNQRQLVFADWLEEHNEADRADVIRLRLELAVIAQGDQRREELLNRHQDLLMKHGGEWVEQNGLPMTWGEVLAIFRKNLAKTIAWCQGRTLRRLHPVGDRCGHRRHTQTRRGRTIGLRGRRFL